MRHFLVLFSSFFHHTSTWQELQKRFTSRNGLDSGFCHMALINVCHPDVFTYLHDIIFYLTTWYFHLYASLVSVGARSWFFQSSISSYLQGRFWKGLWKGQVAIYPTSYAHEMFEGKMVSIKLIDAFVWNGNVGVKVNDDVGHYFQARKGWDKEILCPPFSLPLSYILVVLIAWAKEAGKVCGRIPQIIDDGVSML